jgi:carbon-monoxide dehydrogenase medium subunit
VKGAPFTLHMPRGIDEAISCLTEAGGDARLLAGGQSLMPLMAMRRVSPAALVDLSRVADLDRISNDPDGISIGAMTRQRVVERDPQVIDQVRLLAMATPHIAHVTVRNQGTIGGSIAHADPTAELPTVALATNAVMVIRGPGGARSVAAGDFFAGPHATAVAADELLVEVRFPTDPSGSRCAFVEFGRRPGDVAIVGVAVMIVANADGAITEARIAISSVAPTPIRVGTAEHLLVGHVISPALFEASAELAARDLDPPTDLNGSAPYRRHLTRVLVRRALIEATLRVNG